MNTPSVDALCVVLKSLLNNLLDFERRALPPIEELPDNHPRVRKQWENLAGKKLWGKESQGNSCKEHIIKRNPLTGGIHINFDALFDDAMKEMKFCYDELNRFAPKIKSMCDDLGLPMLFTFGVKTPQSQIKSPVYDDAAPIEFYRPSTEDYFPFQPLEAEHIAKMFSDFVKTEWVPELLATVSLNKKQTSVIDITAHARARRAEKLAVRDKAIVSKWRSKMNRKPKPSQTEAARRVAREQTPPLSEDQVIRILKKANVWESAKPTR